MAALGIAVSASVSACAGSSGGSGEAPAATPATRRDAPIDLYAEVTRRPAQSIDPSDLRFVGMDDGPVPDFWLRTSDGTTFDSGVLVGERAFAFVFFATWCQVCSLKLVALREALRVVGDVTVIAVAVDDADTWPRVPGYLRQHGLRLPVVRAEEHPRFAIEYNPFSTVPLVVVVGRNGGLVDFQLGYTSEDRERLIAAVNLAKTIGPLAQPPH